MIINEVRPNVYDMLLKVTSITLGNTEVDKITGWDKIEYSFLKIRCTDCTVMVFGIEKMMLFKDYEVGSEFKARVRAVPKYDSAVYNFDRFIS